MSSVHVRRIWEKERVYIERKKLDLTLQAFCQRGTSRSFNGFLMVRGTIFLSLRRLLQKSSISNECRGNSSHCKAQAVPLSLFFLILLLIDRTGFRNSVPVMFIVFPYLKRELSQLLLAVVCS